MNFDFDATDIILVILLVAVIALLFSPWFSHLRAAFALISFIDGGFR